MSYQRDFDRKINIGLVGVGAHAYRNILPALHFLPVNLRALCDMNLELARKTAPEFGVANCYQSAGEMYRNENLDAVLLCVSPQHHPTLACEAFGAGLHVWMEKPAAMRVAQVDEMLAQRGERACVVGYKKAFMPATQKALEVLGPQAHQNLRTILAQYAVSVPKDGAAVLEEGRASDWLGNSSHPLSLMIAVGGTVRSVTTHHAHSDDSVCVLEYASGALGTLHTATVASQPSERFTFFSDHCTVTIENSWRVTVQRGIPFDYGKTVTYAPAGMESGALVWEPQNSLATLENQALFTQGFYGSLRTFCDQVLNGTREYCGSLEFARHVTQIYEAALLSNGQRIEISA